MSAEIISSNLEEAARVDFAYQPIVSTASLQVHGFEALGRPAGGRFANVVELLNASYSAGELRSVERRLLQSAIGKFCHLTDRQHVRLFCNIDNRIYEDSPWSGKALLELLDNTGMRPSDLCVEISEEHPVTSYPNLKAAAQTLAAHDSLIAIDDFGIGNSGLHMLLQVEPHYVKIDQFFVAGLATNSRKQAIVAKLCGLAHALGFRTVAEGVENESDFRMARDLGCDLAQGFHIARPTTDLRQLSYSYDRASLQPRSRKMPARVAELLSPATPVYLDQPLADAVETFKAQPSLRLLPVIDKDESVQGAIFEEDVRQFMLSDFGRDLLANKGMDARISRLVRRCAVAESGGTVEAIINSYVAAETASGLILLNEGRFAGYLTNNSLLRLAAEREVNLAREQNPLTRLPGNSTIDRHWDDIIASPEDRLVALMDFDNFKAFNDIYGFAMGDRALLMFSDLLRLVERSFGAFVGHIGGDDFVLTLPRCGPRAEQIVRDLQARFARDAESLYSADHRAAGGITTLDRFGVARFFPLLTVSAGVIHLKEGEAKPSRQDLLVQLSDSKSRAKRQGADLEIASMAGREERAPESKRAA
jgi:diguanylate cyclase (GGDEF)-like protein